MSYTNDDDDTNGNGAKVLDSVADLDVEISPHNLKSPISTVTVSGASAAETFPAPPFPNNFNSMDHSNLNPVSPELTPRKISSPTPMYVSSTNTSTHIHRRSLS